MRCGGATRRVRHFDGHERLARNIGDGVREVGFDCLVITSCRNYCGCRHRDGCEQKCRKTLCSHFHPVNQIKIAYIYLPAIRSRSSSRFGVRAFRESIQLLHKRIIQPNQSRRGIFFKVFDLGGAGNRQHHRRFPQQPGDCDLRGLGLQALRDKLQRSARFREIAGSEGKPGDEPDIFIRAVIQHVLVLSLNQVVQVLYSSDRDEGARQQRGVFKRQCDSSLFLPYTIRQERKT